MKPTGRRHSDPDEDRETSHLWKLIWRLLDLLTGGRCGHHNHGQAAVIVASFGPPELKTRKVTMLQKTITNEEQIPFTIKFTTALGHPAEVDGPVNWEIVDGNSTFTNLSEDGKSLKFRSEDGLGITHFRATADADLGAGNVPVTLDVEITVVGPQASQAGGDFGDAEPKDEAKGGKKGK